MVLGRCRREGISDACVKRQRTTVRALAALAQARARDAGKQAHVKAIHRGRSPGRRHVRSCRPGPVRTGYRPQLAGIGQQPMHRPARQTPAADRATPRFNHFRMDVRRENALAGLRKPGFGALEVLQETDAEEPGEEPVGCLRRAWPGATASPRTAGDPPALIPP